MANNTLAAQQQNPSARSGKTESLDEVLTRLGFLNPEAGEPTDTERLVAILARIQHMRVPDHYILMSENWDWLVVLQCLQDHGLFKTNPQRPPFTDFNHWCHQANIPEVRTKRKMRTMSHVNSKLKGARYPWTDTKWHPQVLARWRVLYQTLDHMLVVISSHNDMV